MNGYKKEEYNRNLDINKIYVLNLQGCKTKGIKSK